MKKIQVLIIVAFFFCGTVSVQAQNVEYETKHELGVSYGGAPLSVWARIGEALGEAIINGLTGGSIKYDNTSWFGSLSGEYFYRIDPAFSIGGIACFSQDNDDILVDNVKTGDRTTRFITVMPAVKWDYLRRNNFGMYMKFGGGYTFERVTETYKGQDGSNNSGFFNMQISLLGLEGGSKNVRGFFELGFGEQGVVLVGLRCKL
jgi:hypothetical protein